MSDTTMEWIRHPDDLPTMTADEQVAYMEMWARQFRRRDWMEPGQWAACIAAFNFAVPVDPPLNGYDAAEAYDDVLLALRELLAYQTGWVDAVKAEHQARMHGEA